MPKPFGNISKKIEESSLEITQALEISKRNLINEIHTRYEAALKKSLFDVTKKLNHGISMHEKKLRSSFNNFESALAINIKMIRFYVRILMILGIVMFLLLVMMLKQIMVNQELQKFYIKEKEWVLPKEMRTQKYYEKIHEWRNQ